MNDQVAIKSQWSGTLEKTFYLYAVVFHCLHYLSPVLPRSISDSIFHKNQDRFRVTFHLNTLIRFIDILVNIEWIMAVHPMKLIHFFKSYKIFTEKNLSVLSFKFTNFSNFYYQNALLIEIDQFRQVSAIYNI